MLLGAHKRLGLWALFMYYSINNYIITYALMLQAKSFIFRIAHEQVMLLLSSRGHVPLRSVGNPYIPLPRGRGYVRYYYECTLANNLL